MNLRIRKAAIGDSQTIAEFNRRMALETEQKDLDPEIVLKGVKAIFKDQHKGFYLLAEFDLRIIAQLLVTYEWSDWRNKNFWWIQSVYVLPEFRKRGVFAALFNHLREKAADSRGVAGIRLYVEKTNRQARDVYLNLGMVESHYLFYELEF